MAITELHLLIVDLALIVFDRTLILLDRLLLVIQGLVGDGVPRHGFLVARQIDLCLLQEALIVLQRAFRLFELGFIGPRVDFDQRLALANHLPFAIVDRDDPSCDLAIKTYGRDRGDGAEGVDMDAHVALANRGRLDGDDGGLIQCALVWFGLGFVSNQQHDAEDKQDDKNNAKPGTTFSFTNGRGTRERIRMQARGGTLHGRRTPVDHLICYVA